MALCKLTKLTTDDRLKCVKALGRLAGTQTYILLL